MRVAILGAAIAAVLSVSGPANAGLADNLSTLVGDQAVGYLQPLADGLSASLNAGLYRNGNIPKAGFSVRLDLLASVISFDDADRSYTAPAFGGYPEAEVPTVVGNPGGQSVDHGSVNGLSFNYPGGFDMDGFGTAVPQLTLGNVIGTRLIFRWTPKVQLGDDDLGEFQIWGLGAQHSISQYISDPPFALAIGGVYQEYEVGSDELIKGDTYNLNITGSKRFGAAAAIEPYLGFGVDSFAMEVKYDDGNEIQEITFDRENDFRTTIGVNLSVPVVSLHGEAYFANQNGYALSISFGV